MGEVGAAYAGCRGRIAELVGGLDDRRAAMRVPACPDWSVHDVVAHLAGGVDDVLAGRLDGLAMDWWTARQVEARRDRSVSEILGEWEANAAAFEQLLDGVGEAGRQGVADIVSHEHDIRSTLGQPGARDSDAVRIAVGWLAEQVVASATAHGVALRLCTTDGTQVGPEEADAMLTADAFELLRAMTGRRSVDQLREMTWRGDCEAAIPAFTWLSLHPSSRRIEE